MVISGDSSLHDRMERLVAEYEGVIEELADPVTLGDTNRLRDLSRKRKELDQVVSVWRALKSALGDLTTARQMEDEADVSERELVHEELRESEAAVYRLEDQLRALLLPQDPNDGRNVIVEIRGAEGGEEANLFARDLYTMYGRFADRHHWGIEVLSESVSGKDGLNEAVFVVKGEDAWRFLEHEAGGHRVQRVPVTESKGRVHTSAATVSVLPEADEVDLVIDPADLKIDVYRSTGPGGQSVNTTDSAVRITHLPSGMVVAMQDEKSQIQNRAKAMTVLRARLLKAEQDKQASKIAATRRSQVGSGGRSEKVRTYNFKENRVTDHRIAMTVHRLDQVLEGDLDDFAEALMDAKLARQLEEGHLVD
ncbi:MAG: peptide chain release factor 1 [Acidimicrobiales bacterium]